MYIKYIHLCQNISISQQCIAENSYKKIYVLIYISSPTLLNLARQALPGFALFGKLATLLCQKVTGEYYINICLCVEKNKTLYRPPPELMYCVCHHNIFNAISYSITKWLILSMTPSQRNTKTRFHVFNIFTAFPPTLPTYNF